MGRPREEQPGRLTYMVEEAAKLLGISRAFAYECVNRGEIPHIRLGDPNGGRILIPHSALHRLVESAGVTDHR